MGWKLVAVTRFLENLPGLKADLHKTGLRATSATRTNFGSAIDHPLPEPVLITNPYSSQCNRLAAAKDL
jgi:hypothetical protein